MFSVYYTVSGQLFNNLVSWPHQILVVLRQALWPPCDSRPWSLVPANAGLYGVYGIFLLLHAACRQPSTHAETLQAAQPFSWLPLLTRAACFFVPLGVLVFHVALGSGAVAKAMWCMVAGGACLPMVPAVLRQLRVICRHEQTRQQQQSQAKEGHQEWQQQRQQQQEQSGQQGQRRVQHETLWRWQHNTQYQALHPPPVMFESESRSYLGSCCGSTFVSDNEVRSQPFMEATAAMESSPARPSRASPAASSSTVALAEALSIVKKHGLMSYSCAVQSAHVHLLMQPGELRPGWRTELERQFAGQGWCLLSTAVRCGGNCISTLANIHEGHRAAPAAAAYADVVAAEEVDAEQAAGRPVGWEVRTGALPAGGVEPTEPSLLGTPNELLAGLQMSRQELGPGFSFTVQAMTDDSRRHRVRYVCQPNGSWLKGPFDGCCSRPAALAPCVMSRGATGGAAVAEAIQLSSGSQGHSQDLNLHGNTDSPGVSSIKQQSQIASSVNTDSSRSSRGDVPAAGMDAVKQADLGRCGMGSFDARDASEEWVLRTPYVVLGAHESGIPTSAAAAACHGGNNFNNGSGSSVRAQRYDTHVWAGAVISSSQPHGSSGAGAVEAGACGDWGDEVTMGDPWGDCDVVFRVRSLGFPCKELKVCQVLAQQSVASSVTRGSQGADSGMGFGCGHGSCNRGNVAGGRGRIWALTVWDEPVPAQTGPKTVASPQQQQPPGRCGGGGRRAGAAPFLVDMSAWRGQELLTARMVLFVPQAPPSASSADGGDYTCTNGGGDVASRRRWTRQLSELLTLHPPNVAQHVIVDLGLFLSGALEGVLQAAQLLPPSAPAPEVEGKVQVGSWPAGTAAATPAPLAASGSCAGTGASTASATATAAATVHGDGLRVGCQLVLLLDLGTSLLSLVLRHGCCALVELLWNSLKRLGFGAEEVLLHGIGSSQGSWPLLHAAVASGKPQATDLVLSWYAAASLPEPWLQPMRIPGSPAVLTPLALASAASPSGDLLLHILRNHPQGLVAWRVRVNGASGRSVAAAAGLRAVVLEGDVRTAVAPAAAAVAAAGQFCLAPWRHGSCLLARRWPLWLPRSRGCTAAMRQGGFRPQLLPAPSAPQPSVAVAEPPCYAVTAAVLAASSFPSGSSSRRASCRWPALHGVGKAVELPALVTGPPGKCTMGLDVGAGPLTMDLGMLVAQGTRTQMVAFQVAIVLYQLLAQLKALLGSFQATCPMAAAAASPGIGWSWLPAARLVGRCVAGRLWWTVLEAMLAAMMASPLGLRWHWLCCAAAAATRCIYQGTEGSLLPPAEMSAYGPQMSLAYLLFVLVTACCYQAPCRVNIFLRLAEAIAGSRVLYMYGVTSRRQRVVVQATCMETLGWVVGAVLRSRPRVALRRQQQLTTAQATAATKAVTMPTAIEAT